MPPPVLAAVFAHPDGRLPEVDADELVGEIVRFLREWRPRIVVTFGPEGAPTRHRDHRDAFERDCLTPTEDFALVADTPQPAPIVDDLFAGLAAASPERESGRRRP